MKYSERIGNKLYQNLGKLFYAIAMADKKVRPSEIAKLKTDVQKFWLHLDKVQDAYDTDAAYQIEIVFDWLYAEGRESDIYYQEFVDFFKDHRKTFDDQIRQLIWKTADGIASSFADKNKSELILLAKLKKVLAE